MKNEKSTKNSPLADKLNVLMKRSGVNKSGLARICGITPQASAKWFITGNISKESAIKIAEAFNVSLEWLLGDEQETLSSERVTYHTKELTDKHKLLLWLFDRLPENDKDRYIQSLKDDVDRYDGLFRELLKTRDIDDIIYPKKS
jgi:transcriptional regulator with XRE-family HTH domain